MYLSRKMLVLVIACLQFTSSYGEDFGLRSAQILEAQPGVETASQKIYVHPSQVYFSDNQIFVQTPKGLMPIRSLESDSGGIYYKAEHPYSWYCQRILKKTGKKCGHYNTYTYYCEHCGRAPIPKKEEEEYK